MTSLLEIERSRDVWAGLIGAAAVAGVPRLRDAFLGLVRRQDEADTQAVINATLDLAKIEQFKRELVASWKENARVRAMLERCKAVRMVAAAPPDQLLYGVNATDRKDLYVADSRIHSKGWGRQYGERIAAQETELILDPILKALSPVLRMRAEESLAASLDDLISTLRSDGFEPNAILLISAWRASMDLAANTSKWSARKPNDPQWIAGYYDGLSVAEVHKRGKRGVIVLADFNRLGALEQFDVANVESGEKREVFTISIEPFDEAKARRVIAEDANWLRDRETKNERSADVATREILQRIHLRIFQQFRYVIADAKAGRQVSISEAH